MNPTMSAVAFLLYVLYLGVGFGLRTWLQWRRTGDSGFRGISGAVGTPEWLAGVGFGFALVAGILGPVTALLGLDALGSLTAGPVQLTGAVLAVVGIVATFLTQLEMGSSWRIGVDEDERTDLVTGGAFALVRNPIFTAMAVTGLGLTLMVPNVMGIVGLVLLLLALQLQVRVVEEPYLVRAHGRAYAAYAVTTGRFLPGLGRLTPSHADQSRLVNEAA